VAGNPRIDELRKKLDKEPGSRLFAQLAEELRKDGDLEDAIRVAREGLEKHSNYPSARMTLGRALFDTGDWSAARAEFELVLKGAPDNILASRLLAESLESLGDIPAAIARYKKTLALAPGDKQVLARLDALEKGGTPVALAAPPAAAAPKPAEPRAPIPVVAVDTPMELEQPHERASTFAPGPAAAPPPAAPRPPSSESSVAPRPAGSEPAPIPLVAAEEDFELERPYEAPRTSGAAAPPAPAAAQARGPAATPPAARPSAEPPMMEFEFDAGPPGSTIAFAPPPAPAPALAPGPAPALAESAPPTPVPPPPPSVAAAPPEATPLPSAPAAPETRAAFEPPPHTPVPPPAANTVEVAWAAPAPPASVAPVPPASVAAPVPTFAPEPERQPAPPPPAAAPPPAPSPAPEAASGELMSATLAELYFKQGFAEKAVEVYRQLIEREPENDRLRRRLAELQEPRLAPAPASHTGPDQASRRVALERTIAKLEDMLAAIKKG